MALRNTQLAGAWTRALTIGLVAGSVTLVPARAHALLPAAAAAVVAFYTEMYGYISKGYSVTQLLFGESGPDLVAALNKTEADIINEVRSVRNQAWKSHAQTVFDDFEILGLRKRTHSDNPRLWGIAWDLSRQTINDFVEITDTPSMYEMAPAFNALVAVNGALTTMEGEIYPDDPPAWGEYDIYYKRGIRADYAMIGMRKGLCWPGYDPGAGNYGSVSGGHYVKNTFRTSQFYQDKIANKNVAVGDFSVIIQGRGGSNEFLMTGYCNPGKHTCTPLPGINHFPAADSLATAEAIIKPTFDADNTVVAVRAAMNGIMSLAGGDDNFDDPNTDLPTQGQYTEPWIYEPLCVQAVYPYKP